MWIIDKETMDRLIRIRNELNILKREHPELTALIGYVESHLNRPEITAEDNKIAKRFLDSKLNS